MMKLPKSVNICEVGPRDGLQSERTILTVDQKARLIDMMSDAGFKVIEVGSFVSPKAVPQMASTDEVFAKIRRRDGVEYRALVANVRGVDRAIACGCRKVKLNVSASRSHNLANLNCTPEESVAKFGESVEHARDAGIGISGSISMPFGSPWEASIPIGDVERIIDAYLEVGVSEISLSDAAGVADPAQVSEICAAMRAKYPSVSWWLHFHNTRGAGLANILAAMDAGMTNFDSSFAGVGGCPFVPGAAGNVTTEDLLHMCERMGVETGIDIDAAIAAAKLAVEMLGHPTDSFILRAGKASELIRELPKKQTIKPQ